MRVQKKNFKGKFCEIATRGIEAIMEVGGEAEYSSISAIFVKIGSSVWLYSYTFLNRGKSSLFLWLIIK